MSFRFRAAALRHLVFRDRLRASPDDRAQYEQVKRELAGQLRDMNPYADAKSGVIQKSPGDP